MKKIAFGFSGIISAHTPIVDREAWEKRNEKEKKEGHTVTRTGRQVASTQKVTKKLFVS
jgi:hypothetical protein